MDSEAERLATSLGIRLSDLFDAITDGVMLIDDRWRITYLNPGGKRLLRDAPEPLVGSTLADAFPELAGSRVEEQLRTVVATGVSDQSEVHWREGGRWGEVKMFPTDGQLMLYFTDITEEKEAADEAARLIERLNRLLAVSRAATDRISSREELFDAVPRMVADVLGAETALFYLVDGDAIRLRSSFGPSVGPEELPRHESLAGRAVDTRQVLSTADLQSDDRAAVRGQYPQHRAAMAAGFASQAGVFGAIVVTDRRVGLFDRADEHSFELVIESLTSASDRFDAVEALQRNEERFRLVAQATTDAAYDSEFDTDSMWFSDGYHSLFGRGAGEQSGLLWQDAVHPDDRAAVLAEMQAAFDDPSVHVHELEYRLARAAGGYASVIDRMFILRDRTGTAVRVVGGLRDVTSEVEAEQRMRRAQRLEAVGQLTGGVAHDFNNLLTVILGAIDQLADRPDRDEATRFVDLIRASAERGADLSHRLLAFARQQPLEPRPTVVAGLVEELAPLLRRTLRDDVELRLEHDDGVWPALVDPSQLENALLNLCLNARDAMPDGGVLTVRTDSIVLAPETVAADDEVEPGDYVVVSVADTGSGIDPEHLVRVFEPFFTTKPTGAGTGLGLSMVHGFVKQSAGHVTIESSPGVGTTVSMLLPRTAIAPGPQPAPAPGAARGDRAAARILVVEDDDAVRTLVARFLETHGHDVVTAASGVEALEVLARADRFDLLFTDLAMPGGVNGRDLAERAVAMHPDLAVLYTSGYPEGTITHDGRLDAGLDLIQKPYRVDELVDRVSEVIARSSRD